MRSIAYYARHPYETLLYTFNIISFLLPDKIHLLIEYRLKMGKKLNLEDPHSFCEKIQWLKLYNRKIEYSKLVDKLTVKQFVADTIGNKYVIPTLGVWDKVEDIDFDQLPNRFVLKTSHGGGSVGVLICKDKEKLDKQKAIKSMRRAMKQNIYKTCLEWPYKNIPKKIFAEQYMEDNPDVPDLPDYKWYCFNGEPMFCQVIQDRKTKETIDFFDTEWKHQEFIGLNPNVDNAIVLPERPAGIETMLSIARKLSKDIPFARVDLYVINNNIYFGEITLYPASGMGRFRPEQYDQILGQLLVLPTEKHC